MHPLARRGDRQALRPGGALAGGHGRDDHAGAGGGRGRGRAVELPGPDGGLEAGAGAGDRQQRRDQARLDHVAQPPQDRRAGCRGRHPRGRAQRRDRTGRHGRRGDRPSSRHRCRRLHRLDRGRPAIPDLVGGVESQARAARARRQEPADRVRRRDRHGRRGGQRRDRDLLEHGRELQRRIAPDRPSLTKGRPARRAAGGARVLAGRGPARPGHEDRRDHLQAASRARARLRAGGARGRGTPGDRRPSGSSRRPVATSSDPRSSTA